MLWRCGSERTLSVARIGGKPSRGTSTAASDRHYVYRSVATCGECLLVECVRADISRLLAANCRSSAGVASGPQLQF